MNKLIGVLFDINALGGPTACEEAAWRILMKHLDLREMPNIVFYQGELEINPGKPKCFCIAISDFIPATGGRGCKHFVPKMETATDAGLYPPKDRLYEGEALLRLTTVAKVDADASVRLSLRSGELGNLMLVTLGREFGWKVLPGEDLLPKFASNFLTRKTLGNLDEATRQLCESLLKEVGYDATIAAIRASRLPAEQMRTTCEGITMLIWPEKHAAQAQTTSPAKRPGAAGKKGAPPRKWWEIWKKAS